MVADKRQLSKNFQYLLFKHYVRSMYAGYAIVYYANMWCMPGSAWEGDALGY